MKVYCESKLSRLRNKLIHLTSFNGFCKIRHFQQCPQQLKSGKQIKNWLHTPEQTQHTISNKWIDNEPVWQQPQQQP